MEVLLSSFPPIKTLFHPSEINLLPPTKPRSPNLPRRFTNPNNNFSNQRTQFFSASSSGERNSILVKEELREAAEEALEWRSVCSQLSAFASTAAAREACRSGKLPVGRDRAESQNLLDQTTSAVLLPEKLDFSGVDDVGMEVVRKAVEGNVLGIREICAVGKCLESANRVSEQLARVSAMEEGSKIRYYQPLLDILRNCDFPTELVNKIGFCIDCNLYVVLDRASTRLEAIRTERRQNVEKLERLLKEESIKVFKAGGIDSPLITKRRARMCIGVKASHRSLLPRGVVLSASSSGATYFMEPNGAVQLNNAEVILSNSEKDEEVAILGILTYEIVQSEMRIRHLIEKIVEIDLACARAAYALWMDGVCPIFYEVDDESINENELLVDIEGIHHPLLLQPFITQSSSGVSPVPVDIKIEPAVKVVVISGPNTGGKTATLKILGLASLMSKAGMFLPAKKEPRIPWFDQILADIGDHQSLEHNLSTFSGHISRICKIIQVTTKESLVLIDEIGSGTDPSEGLALSSSILQHLAECVNLVVVTTHYADLSLLKVSDSRFKNAAMEFCTKTLRPTYRVLWGSTGNSNAFDIAMSIGFDLKVLDRAREWAKKLAPDKQKERQGLLYQSLVKERSALEYQAKEAASLLLDVKQLYQEIQDEAQDLSTRETALKAIQYRNLQQELKSARTQMEAVIKNFEDQLQTAEPDQFNSLLRKSELTISSIVSVYQTTSNKTSEEEIGNNAYTPEVGDSVYVKGFGDKAAVVVEAPKDDGIVVVQCGRIKLRAKKYDIRPVPTSSKDKATSSGVQIPEQKQRQHYNKSAENEQADGEVSFGPAVKTSKNTVDLRGMRVEPASHYLQIALSECKSNSVLFIIHGTGTGAVKERALDILQNHPRVMKFEEESPMNYGCTLAYIR